MYGAALYRLRAEDFGELKHHDGLSPAWPIDYADLEPYYTQAEHLYLVHGRHGEDPFEGPYSADYAHPPVEHEPRIQQLSDDLEKQGLHPFHLPIGVNLEQDADGQATRASACIRCDRVDGFPCLVQAKSDSQVICVDPAVASGGIELLTGAYVERLETDGRGGSVTGVCVRLDGTPEAVTFSADVVVVSAGAVNSAALLLRSANDRHPNGLANSSDVVGRHYMAHLNSAVVALSSEPNPTKFQKTLGVNDFYWNADDFPHPLGHIQMLGKSDKDTLRAGAPWFAPGPALDYMARHGIDFWLTTEDLPKPGNRVTVGRDGSIHLAKTEYNLEAHRRLLGRLKSLLGPMGMHERMIPRWSVLDQRIPLAGIAHQSGTVRFGSDP